MGSAPPFFNNSKQVYFLLFFSFWWRRRLGFGGFGFGVMQIRKLVSVFAEDLCRRLT
jgi:hypothetical protein